MRAHDQASSTAGPDASGAIVPATGASVYSPGPTKVLIGDCDFVH